MGVGRVQHLLVLNDPAVSEPNDSLAVASHIFFVCDDNNRLALRIQVLKQRHDLFGRARVQISCWFIPKNDHRIIDDRSGNRHPLLLSAGKFIRPMMHALGKPNTIERALGSLSAVARTGVHEGKLDVLERRRSRQKIECLEHEPDVSISDVGKLVVVHPRDRLAVEHVFALGGPVQASDQVHKR